VDTSDTASASSIPVLRRFDVEAPIEGPVVGVVACPHCGGPDRHNDTSELAECADRIAFRGELHPIAHTGCEDPADPSDFIVAEQLTGHHPTSLSGVARPNQEAQLVHRSCAQ
jgi:hypothetical protein